VRGRDGGVVGPAATEMIDQYRVDYGIIGISGIDEDGALLDFDQDEIRAAQAIIRNARRTFLVADHAKFARRPMLRMGWISEVSALFTDLPPPEGIRAILEAGNVALHVTG
jgi:DeoR family glycerol-3-phosphate regulon repressor